MQININYNSNTLTTGSGNTGINFPNPYNLPYDPNGPTPDPSQYQIDWSNPNSNAVMMQAEQAYEKLVNWLQNNPTSYNGYLMLLQMTMDIGNNMGNLSSQDQAQLTQFMGNQMTGSNTNLMALILDISVEGAAVNNPNVADGTQAAFSLLGSLNGMFQKLNSLGGVFSALYTEGQNLANPYNMAPGSLNQWIQENSGSISGDNGSSAQYWMDGSSPMSFEDFTANAALQVGSFITGINGGGNVGSYIDSMYQSEIQELEQMTKNPWELLILLLGLIDQRDQDNGQDINGYGNNLNTLSKGNGLITDMLNMLKGVQPNPNNDPTIAAQNTKNMQQFYSDFSQLKAIITQNPNFSQLTTEFTNIEGILNTQSFPLPSNANYTTSPFSVNSGYIQLPNDVAVYDAASNKTYVYNGSEIQVYNGNGESGTPTLIPSSTGEFYISQNTTLTVTVPAGGTYTFGDAAGLGDYQDIASVIANAPGGQSSTISSTLANVMTSFQSIFDAPSNGITQQINNKTTIMQTIESFEQSAYQSIVNQEKTASQNMQSAGS